MAICAPLAFLKLPGSEDRLGLVQLDGLGNYPSLRYYVVSYQRYRRVATSSREGSPLRVFYEDIHPEPFLEFDKAVEAYQIRSRRIDGGFSPSGIRI